MTSNKIYYLYNGTKQLGPFNIEELMNQNIDLNTPVWFEGMNDWSTIGEIDELKNLLLTKQLPNQHIHHVSIEGNNIKKASINYKKINDWIILLFGIGSICLLIDIHYIFTKSFYNYYEQDLFFSGDYNSNAVFTEWILIIGIVFSSISLIFSIIKKKSILLNIISIVIFSLCLANLYYTKNKVKQICSEIRTWSLRNFNEDRFANGDVIPEARSAEEWKIAAEKKQPAWCYYNNDPANGEQFGKLYNFYAVTDPRGLNTISTSLPNDGDWVVLINFLGGEHEAVEKMKFGGSDSIAWENGNGNNSSGFNALPGGYRDINGNFSRIGNYGIWWSNSSIDEDRASAFSISSIDNFIIKSEHEKGYGYSVRLKIKQ